MGQSRSVKGRGSARTEGARRATGVRADGAAGVGALGPGQRWSAGRKREVVLRLLRGESLDALSREVGVEIYRLEDWKERALAAHQTAPGCSYGQGVHSYRSPPNGFCTLTAFHQDLNSSVTSTFHCIRPPAYRPAPPVLTSGAAVSASSRRCRPRPRRPPAPRPPRRNTRAST